MFFDRVCDETQQVKGTIGILSNRLNVVKYSGDIFSLRDLPGLPRN